MAIIPRQIICTTTTEVCTSYASYLHSNHWHNVRDEFSRSPFSKKRCYVCLSRENINHHHRSYANIGKEQPNDLVELCNSCHGKVHGIARKGGMFNDICFAVERLRHDTLYPTKRKKTKYAKNIKILTFDDL